MKLKKHIDLLNELKGKEKLENVTIAINGRKHKVEIDDTSRNDFTLLRLLKQGIEDKGVIVVLQKIKKKNYLIAGIGMGNGDYYYFPADALDDPRETSDICTFENATFDQLKEKTTRKKFSFSFPFFQKKKI